MRGGRYWVRTSDLFGVNEARYHCANRPSRQVDETHRRLPFATLTHVGGAADEALPTGRTPP